MLVPVRAEPPAEVLATADARYYGSTVAGDWLARYASRLRDDPQPVAARRARMDAANPLYVPRNWLLQQAIDAAEQGDTSELEVLSRVLERPYEAQPGAERFAAMRPAWALDRPGCSALSCSS